MAYAFGLAQDRRAKRVRRYASTPPGRRVKRVIHWCIRPVLRTGNIQINHHRFLPAAHNHSLHRLILAGIQFLMGNIRRNINKISRPRFVDKLQLIPPSEPRPSPHHINHRLQFAMMMRPGLGVRLHHYSPRPKFLCPNTSPGDGLGASHTWSLRSIRIQFAAANNS